MIIDLSGLFKDYGGSIDVSENCKFSSTEFLGDEFVFPNGLDVKGKITNNTKSLHFKACVSGELSVPCARCLKPVHEFVSFEVSEILVKEGEENSEDEDVVVISGDEFEIDEIIINNFLMNSSGKYLCKEDCKGLCPVCGKDLNEGECNCGDDEIDPRWQALADIMKNSDTE